jgi:hypothetical protein
MEADSMFLKLEKYIGQTIEMIYLDKSGQLSQRRIRIRAIRGGFVLAMCLQSGAPRTFRIDGILALQPVHSAG